MINLTDFQILSENKDTLKRCSKSTHVLPIIYMNCSPSVVVNFDRVKNAYTKRHKIKGGVKSNDALFAEAGGELVFVEFKNGEFDNLKKYDVTKKIYDSVLVFTDITGHGISFLREHMSYILVYNDIKNPPTEAPSKSVSDSENFIDLAKNVAKSAKEELVLWGLDAFTGYCFKSVHTYTEREFEEYLAEHPPITMD